MFIKGSRTAHFAFRTSVSWSAEFTCSISVDFTDFPRLWDVSFITVDEIVMYHHHFNEVLDHTLKEILQNQHPFREKVILFPEDIPPVPSVASNGSCTKIVNACVTLSFLLHKF